MKKQYVSPEIEQLVLSPDDVIRTSLTNGGNGGTIPGIDFGEIFK